MLTEQVVVQPLESVTVTECEPALSPMAVAVVSPLSQRKVFPALPPVGDTVALPFFPPLQLTGLSCDAVQLSAAGWVMVTPQLVLQPLESVTSTVCGPALSAMAVAVVSPLSQRK